MWIVAMTPRISLTSLRRFMPDGGNPFETISELMVAFTNVLFYIGGTSEGLRAHGPKASRNLAWITDICAEISSVMR